MAWSWIRNLTSKMPLTAFSQVRDLNNHARLNCNVDSRHIIGWSGAVCIDSEKATVKLNHNLHHINCTVITSFVMTQKWPPVFQYLQSISRSYAVPVGASHPSVLCSIDSYLIGWTYAGKEFQGFHTPHNRQGPNSLHVCNIPYFSAKAVRTRATKFSRRIHLR